MHLVKRLVQRRTTATPAAAGRYGPRRACAGAQPISPPRGAMAVQSAICLFDGVDEPDATGRFEALERARRMGAPACQGRPVRAAAILVVPGGGWPSARTMGAGRSERPDLVRAVATPASNAAFAAAVGPGTMVVAPACPVRGREPATHRNPSPI